MSNKFVVPEKLLSKLHVFCTDKLYGRVTVVYRNGEILEVKSEVEERITSCDSKINFTFPFSDSCSLG